ncbi:uncharacterized protein LOC107826082 [Nicotiana tabacum]|uniref:Uncharacterized protein LOC107826082 n=1 Tax=Nicotiana tabacum TaxID=4097 RepID=A0AC58UCI8_TOBAC
MASPNIQKEIVTACKIETIKDIIEDLNGDYFSLLVDESFDVSRKEQMAIVLRYVYRKGFVMEAFIGLVHVPDTSALSLKKAMVNVLAHHSLSLSSVRGQCYDGARNMQGDINSLKMLIKQESRSAHSIHCFAHQLLLTLVAVSKKCIQVGELVLLVSNILNGLGASFKRMDKLRESQKEKLQEALYMGELETDASTLDNRAKAAGYLRSCQTFEVAFMLHFMKDILGITYDLNISLHKKEQDIAKSMILVEVAKQRLQDLRVDRWYPLKNKVSTFCIMHDILIPNFDEPYANSGRSRRTRVDHTTLHHYRVDVFYKIIDWQLQELNGRFNEVTSDLFHGVACLNPVDSFSSFDIRKIMRMAKLYPDDIDEFNLVVLENQLANHIVDVLDFSFNDEK